MRKNAWLDEVPPTRNARTETSAKGPPLTVVVPFSGAPPRLLTVKKLGTVLPAATVPKFRVTGVTLNTAGAKPLPVTGLVEMPPVLVKMTLVLKLAVARGRKVTVTTPVWP